MNVGEYLSYTYTGDVRTFTAPASGTYQLEVWGAQGGTYNGNGGGKGGYSKGEIALEKDDVLYIVIGGKGNNAVTTAKTTVDGGYNGGGNGYAYNANQLNGSGGGATHIAKRTGLLYELENYKSDILIVAGGGGGCGSHNLTNVYSGGTGGGLNGGDAEGINVSNPQFAVIGATQTSAGHGSEQGLAGSFGKGCNAETKLPSGGQLSGSGGAGGGYYGGGCGSYAGGSGGSGYIGGVANGVTENGVRESNGYAVITLLSKDIAGYVGTEPFEAMYIGDTEITYIVGTGA